MLFKSTSRGSGPLSPEALTAGILRGGEVTVRRFDPKSAATFVNKSVSEETRGAYGRVLKEFLARDHPRQDP